MVAREQHPSLGMVARITELGFPQGSSLINSIASMGSGDCHLLAKVEMDRSYVDRFVRSLPAPRMLEHWDLPSVSDRGDLPDWWDPRSARKSKSITVHRDEKDGFREWRILIRLDDPHSAVLYLEFLED